MSSEDENDTRVVQYADESERDELWTAAADADRPFLGVADGGIVAYDMLTTDRSLTEEGVAEVTAAAESSDVCVVSLTPVAGRFEVDDEANAEEFADRVAAVVRDSANWTAGRTFEAAIAE